MLNQLLPVDLIQSGNTNVVPLSIHEPHPQLLILPPHGFKHYFGGWLRWIPVPQEGLHPESCVDRGDAATAVAVGLLLLSQPQGRYFSRKSVNMVLRLGLKGVLEGYLLLAKLRRG